MARNNKRFVWVKQDHGFLMNVGVIVDTTTGVNYLFAQRGDVGGLTPLLDENGKPIVTKNIIED